MKFWRCFSNFKVDGVGGRLLAGGLFFFALLLAFNSHSTFAQVDSRVGPKNPPPKILPPISIPPPTNTTPRPRPTPTTPRPPRVKPPVNFDAPAMITMKGGAFLMGDDPSNPNSLKHNVEVSGFQLSKVPITNRQFRQFVEATDYKTDAEKNPTRSEIEQGHVNWRTFAEGREDYPVVWITWHDANEYCQWLNKVAPAISSEEEEYSNTGEVSAQVDEPYRLPTEAEWEFAARGGLEQKPYPWGDKADPQILNCNWDTRSDTLDAARKYLKPVGQQQANSFGVQDMAGNIAQWCFDWFDANYYKTSPARDPLGPEKGQEHSVRGGSWLSPAADCRVTSRQHFDKEARNSHLGFRVARSLPQQFVIQDSDQ